MDIEHYNYPLLKELIAQYPLERGKERLLVVDRKTGGIHHRQFDTFENYLNESDVLVLNDTRVFPARLLGNKDSGGRVELLLVKKINDGRWRCLLRASKTPKPGSTLFFRDDLTARVECRTEDMYEVTFSDPSKILHAGQVPLPPYIDRPPVEIDETMYQTVYARTEGSVAAPTAGLHFTPEYLDRLRGKGVETVFVTLHVGPGTFIPVRAASIEDHKMHEEDFMVSEEAASMIEEARSMSRRIVAVGTTSARVLEHLMAVCGRIVPGPGSTSLFIREGFRFKVVDSLLTNFHLPCSTLLMLVSAFGGYDRIMNAYKAALAERYRFFSYGDAMFII